MTTVLLHGFWGAPADWNDVLMRMPLGRPTWCPDLYADEGLGPDVEPLAWADRFLHRLRAHVGTEPVQLVGYSMGGRLALHALLRVPGLFARALVLSAQPMLTGQSEVERRAWDESWAARFERDAWEDLERDWEALPTLRGSRPTARRRDEALRRSLAASLRNWSPTKHAFTKEDLRRPRVPIDWAFGASDQKYLGVAKQLQVLPVEGQITLIPNAGHRLPQDAPDFIAGWTSEV